MLVGIELSVGISRAVSLMNSFDELHVMLLHCLHLTCLFVHRAALLFAHGDLKWDKFHILISRSTTPDLMKIVSKLDEFISQQFTSSKRALGAMGPITSSVRQKLHEKHKSGDEDSRK